MPILARGILGTAPYMGGGSKNGEKSYVICGQPQIITTTKKKTITMNAKSIFLRQGTVHKLFIITQELVVLGRATVYYDEYFYIIKYVSF